VACLGAKSDAGSPLYLAVAIEVLGWMPSSADAVEENIPEDLTSLLSTAVELMETACTQDLVQAALAMLVTNPSVLLSTDDKPLRALARSGEVELPYIYWAALRQRLKVFLKPSHLLPSAANPLQVSSLQISNLFTSNIPRKQAK